MMEYDEEFLNAISEKVDLVEYIGNDIELRQKGKEFFGKCTKHIDKTPSFSITPSRNVYYCFSCGRGGGILQYLQDYEGLNFDDAVAKAAKLANEDMSKMCHSSTVKFLRKVRMMKKRTKEIYHEILSEEEYEKYPKEEITEWLEEGIRQREIEIFDIRVDKRSNRIIYPVRDIEGNLINIKGRTRFANYKEMKLMKYMNYKPIGVMDYFQGLNVTLPYIKEKNEAIVFESIKSVMKCYGWGYKNCISAEKHTITDEQLRLLIRLKVNVVFAYDSDVSYKTRDAIETLEALSRFTNVYIIEDRQKLLGGVDAKCSPADKGLKIFEKLYDEKTKVR